MRAEPDDGQEAWARARADLDRLPPEPPGKRAERLRRHRRDSVLAVALVATAVALLLVVVVLDGGIHGPDDVPAWRSAAGAVGMGTGFVLAFGALGGHYRAVRHMSIWQDPLDWLTRGERRHLLRQAQGRSPLEPDRLPLVRHVARMQPVQGTGPAYHAAHALVWTGYVVRSPGTGHFLLALLLTVGAVAVLAYGRRDSRRLERFLDEDLDPRGS